MAAEPVAAAGLGRITLVLAQRHSGSNLSALRSDNTEASSTRMGASVDVDRRRLPNDVRLSGGVVVRQLQPQVRPPDRSSADSGLKLRVSTF